METSSCARCGSTSVIPDAHTKEMSGSGPLAVAVNSKPEAILFKGTHTEYLKALICGDCGHVELYVDNAKQLYNAYCKSKAVVGV